MARPQKQTVDYFPHDAHACAGDTLTVLESRFGNDGYAFWFKLLERLSAADGHYIDCRIPQKWQTLLAKAHVNEATGEAIMVLLLEMKAIDKELWESRVIWCQHLVENLADAYRNRKRSLPQKPVITPDNVGMEGVSTPDNVGMEGVSTPDNLQTILYEKKLNDNKLNKENDTKEKLSLSSDKQGEEVKEKNVYELYMEEIEPVKSDLMRNTLTDAVDTYTEEWVIDAIKEAVLSGKKNWRYIEGILKNWARDGRDASKPSKIDLSKNDPDRFKKGMTGEIIARDLERIHQKGSRTIEEIQEELRAGGSR